MAINWYPGHMAKTKRMMLQTLPTVDAAIELVDARIPLSSKNPDITLMLKDKPRLILLNKSDLSSPQQNDKWLEYYRRQGYRALLFNSRGKRAQALACIQQNVREELKDKLERRKARGIQDRTVRLMVLGIPNVGKSTFINCLCGSARARAEDRPGVTRSKQWIRLDGGLDLLDTPGMLWPKIEDEQAAQKLAMTGAINDLILDTEELAVKLLDILKSDYPAQLAARYKLAQPLPSDSYELLRDIGRRRGFIMSGAEVDTERAATVLIDEFRGGKIGRITLDVL